MDQIYIAVNGQQLGPYTLDQLRQSVAQGENSRDALAWYEGLSTWIPLGQVLDSQPAVATVPPVPAVPASVLAEFTFTKEELRTIARDQNLLMWSLLTGIVAYFLVHLPLLGTLALLGAVAFEIVALYKLGRSLRLRLMWLYCLGLFIPLVGLIILVVVSGKASRILRAYGVRVGFMGGKVGDIKD